MSYVEFEVPENLVERTYQIVEKSRDTGKLKKGTNETTKAVERNIAKLVIIAGDINPQEIVMHLPALCKEKGVPYTFVPSKEELGLAAGINVQTASIAICDPGSAEKDLKELISKINELKK